MMMIIIIIIRRRRKEEEGEEPTCNDRLVRAACNTDVTIFQCDQVFTGGRRGVREFITLVHLSTAESYLGGAVNKTC